MNSHEAEYRRCVSCGAVMAVDPSWLAIAYREAIAVSDVGLVGRNLSLSRLTRRVIRVLFPGAETFLDFGAGNGMFVRMMRDAGWPFRYYDAHGPNLFARGFEAAPTSGYDVVTAFEVLEHLVNPVQELMSIAGSRAILATTLLLPDPAPALEQWWYYTLQSGQHVTLHTERSLDVLAERLGYRRTSCNDVHVLTTKPVSNIALRILVSHRAGYFLTPLCRRPSLLSHDYDLASRT